MTQLKDDLLNWVISESRHLEFSEVLGIESLREQASLRSYFRIITDKGTKVGVISDPNSNINNLFITYSKFFLDNNIKVPRVEAYDHDKGFMLMEDFGDKVLQLEIDNENFDRLIKDSLETIISIQSCKPPSNLKDLSGQNYIEQMSLFKEWFLDKLLDLDLSKEEELILQDSYRIIAEECVNQKRVLCHFDYEFRNLMLLDDDSIGVLDFQDLCVGSYALDLASIVKDIDNPLTEDQMKSYLSFFLGLLKNRRQEEELALNDLTKDVDFVSFQRQFRILGTLSRLHLRDEKSFRLIDLKTTLKFLIKDTQKYEDLEGLSEFLSKKVEPRLLIVLKQIT